MANNYMIDPIFKNRIDAAEKLADKLLPYKSEHPLILALPRGGVPVGYEIAKRLNAPLDTIVSQKIGAPFDPEFGIGAIAPGDIIVFDNESIRSLGLEKKDIDLIVEKETKEMNRRIVHYKSGEYNKSIIVDTVIIVDDGLATGVTARAAIESVKIMLRPKKIIFASPICARDTALHLGSLVDEVICVSEVDELIAIGYWYEEFYQTTDKEVIHCLEEASKNKNTYFSDTY